MDILRVLAAPDLEVRKKTLNLAMELVNSRTVEEVIQSKEAALSLCSHFMRALFLSVSVSDYVSVCLPVSLSLSVSLSVNNMKH